MSSVQANVLSNEPSRMALPARADTAFIVPSREPQRAVAGDVFAAARGGARRLLSRTASRPGRKTVGRARRA